MSDQVTNVTDANFDAEVLKGDKPVLVDCWAESCAPCKAMAPILDDLASEYADKVKITKLNVDQNHGTSVQYRVRSLPTLMLFKNGQVESTRVGALSKSQLIEFIEETI
ncbi:MAG: thioredoxin TrxA [Gammaproteobacteria bacterium]|nr:thioredoxin TrxA [Gammaproteobacteria bacterium]